MHGGKEEEKREKKEESRATKQRLDTRNPCTRYNPFMRYADNNTAGQHDAHELLHTKKE